MNYKNINHINHENHKKLNDQIGLNQKKMNYYNLEVKSSL